MTIDMIAMAPYWEESLRPLKCDRKDDPQVWATSFSRQLALSEREKSLNTKAIITNKS